LTFGLDFEHLLNGVEEEDADEDEEDLETVLQFGDLTMRSERMRGVRDEGGTWRGM
jgi:hypothetical protein